MAGLVKCPRCEWRGFTPFYFNHWQQNHKEEGYFPPVKVNWEEADSRPRPKARRENKKVAEEVEVYNNQSTGQKSSLGKR